MYSGMKSHERLGTIQLAHDVRFKFEQQSSSIQPEYVSAKAGDILVVVGIFQAHTEGGKFAYRVGIVMAADGRVYQCYSFSLQDYGVFKPDAEHCVFKDGAIHGLERHWPLRGSK